MPKISDSTNPLFQVPLFLAQLFYSLIIRCSWRDLSRSWRGHDLLLVRLSSFECGLSFFMLSVQFLVLFRQQFQLKNNKSSGYKSHNAWLFKQEQLFSRKKNLAQLTKSPEKEDTDFCWAGQVTLPKLFLVITLAKVTPYASVIYNQWWPQQASITKSLLLHHLHTIFHFIHS